MSPVREKFVKIIESLPYELDEEREALYESYSRRFGQKKFRHIFYYNAQYSLRNAIETNKNIMANIDMLEDSPYFLNQILFNSFKKIPNLPINYFYY